VRLNGEEIGDFAGTVEALLVAEGIRSEGIAVSVDGEIVPRSQWPATNLTGTEEIEIVAAAAGG
jgi:sulfur carrier protein